MTVCYTNFVLIDFVNLNKPVNHLRIDSFLGTKVVKEAGVFDSQLIPQAQLNNIHCFTGRLAVLRNNRKQYISFTLLIEVGFIEC